MKNQATTLLFARSLRSTSELHFSAISLILIGIFTSPSFAKIDQQNIVGMWLFDDDIESIMTRVLKSVASVSTAGKLVRVWGAVKAQSRGRFLYSD